MLCQKSDHYGKKIPAVQIFLDDLRLKSTESIGSGFESKPELCLLAFLIQNITVYTGSYTNKTCTLKITFSASVLNFFRNKPLLKPTNRQVAGSVTSF